MPGENSALDGWRAGGNRGDVAAKRNRLEQEILLASQVGDLETVTALLQRGVSPSSASPQSGITALMLAVQTSRHAVMEALLDAGCDVEQRDHDRRTAMSHAARLGDAQAIELLAGRGADVDALDAEGSTPLTGAAFWCRDENVRALLRLGADTRAVNADGETAADIARRVGRSDLALEIEQRAITDS